MKLLFLLSIFPEFMISYSAIVENIFRTQISFHPPEEKEGHTVQVSEITRRTHYTKSRNQEIHCWLYFKTTLPENPPPLLILLYGFGAQKDIALEKYAIKLAEKGFSTLTFDYRTWGGSEGIGRQITIPDEQIEDFYAVLKHAITTDGFYGAADTQNIHLVGQSLGGGHVVRIAGEFGKISEKDITSRVKSVVSIVPFLDGPKIFKHRATVTDIMKSSLLMGMAVLDSSLPRIFPLYVQLYASKNDPMGFATYVLTPLQYERAVNREVEYSKARAPLGGYVRKIAARSILNIGRYKPSEFLKTIQIPILFISGDEDEVCPLDLTLEAVNSINKHAQLRGDIANIAFLEVLPLNHYDIYMPDWVSYISERISLFIEKNQ